MTQREQSCGAKPAKSNSIKKQSIDRRHLDSLERIESILILNNKQGKSIINLLESILSYYEAVADMKICEEEMEDGEEDYFAGG
jgi:hypothetical protein